MEPETPTPQSSAPSQKPNETRRGPNLSSMAQSATEGFSEANRSVRLKTAWPRLQRLCPPRSARIWLIGGAPGNFKTQTVLNLALDMASMRQRVLFATLEQTAGEIGMQAIARYSGVNLERLDLAFGREQQELSEQENERVAGATAKLASLEFFLRVHGAERNGASLDAVIASATRNRFDAVLVDHLGMIDRGRGSELEAIPRAANMLRSLARGGVVDGYTPFVCVTTPLSRKRDEDDHPKLSHLRGSGCLEYDADLVMVTQKRTRSEEATGPDIVDGFVLKNRMGRCPVVLQFEADGAISFVRERRPENAPTPTHWQETP
jgi:replicative DNA helicase